MRWGFNASSTGTRLLSLSTIADAKISNPPWVNFQSAGWVSFQSAPTLRAYPVPHGFPNGSGSSISPAAPHPRGGIGKTPCLSAYLLVQACQHLWLGYFDDVYMRFTCVSRTRSSLAPLRLDAGRFSLASRFDLPKIGGYIVPRASDPAVTGRACLGRERVVEQSVPSGVNLRNRNPCDFQVALPKR